MKLFTVLLAAIFALGSAGCSPVAPPENLPENYPAELAPFYEQQLTWGECDDLTAGASESKFEFECTTVTAPMDWAAPEGKTIELAMIRHVASGTGTPLGSLLINPGGPGGSGIDFVAESLDYAVSEDLIDTFNVVGFDPRGVGASSPILCADAATMDEFLYGLVDAPRGSDEWIQVVHDAVAEFGHMCHKSSGDIFGFVDTESAARDMDLMRAVLGDDRLNYLGYSYGTELGATYAELFPERVGRLVLDGAVDPSSTPQEVNVAQAKGFEQALAAYLEWCLEGNDPESVCPFSDGLESSMADVRALLDAVEASPIRNEDGRMLGADTLLTAIIYPLYSKDSWQYLTYLFLDVMDGNTEFAFILADLYNGREDGEYIDNSTEAHRAIGCLDDRSEISVEQMRTDLKELEAAAPTIGYYFGFGALACAEWPVPVRGDTSEMHGAGALPILVIGTTGDPATPYSWAVALAEQLDSGVLVTYDGEGHTAYNKSNSCVNSTVDDFFLRGVVPERDPEC